MSEDAIRGDNTGPTVGSEPAPPRPLSREAVGGSAGSAVGNGSSPEVPAYDAAAVGKVAQRIQVERIELVAAHFERADGTALPDAASPATTPGIGVDVGWRLSDDRQRLGCVLTFGTQFQAEEAPYAVIATFRLIYQVREEPEELTEDELAQFAHWNAVFNAWPYWREYLSSTINRAHLPPFLVPVIGVPRALDAAALSPTT